MWIQPRRAGQEVGKENAHTYRTCRESGHKEPPNGKQVSTGDMAEHRGVLWCIQIHTEAKALLVRQITRFPAEQMCIYGTQSLCSARLTDHSICLLSAGLTDHSVCLCSAGLTDYSLCCALQDLFFCLYHRHTSCLSIITPSLHRKSTCGIVIDIFVNLIKPFTSFWGEFRVLIMSFWKM